MTSRQIKVYVTLCFAALLCLMVLAELRRSPRAPAGRQRAAAAAPLVSPAPTASPAPSGQADVRSPQKTPKEKSRAPQHVKSKELHRLLNNKKVEELRLVKVVEGKLADRHGKELSADAPRTMEAKTSRSYTPYKEKPSHWLYQGLHSR